MENLADLAVAACTCAPAFGLYTHDRIAVSDARDENLVVIDHGGRNAVLSFSRRIPHASDMWVSQFQAVR